MSNHKFPTLLPPDHPDAPKFWMRETSGVLKPVVKAYLDGDPLDVHQIDLMQCYLHQWVRSPVWAPSGALEVLRLRVVTIATREDIDAAIEAAVALAMDPL